jgi:hypothetical protein
MRNSTNATFDPYLRSMEFLCFWNDPNRPSADGEWEAVVSIYNNWNSTSNNDYIVEISRFTWYELQVKLDGNIVVDFPTVTSDLMANPGYTTFHIII